MTSSTFDWLHEHQHVDRQINHLTIHLHIVLTEHDGMRDGIFLVLHQNYRGTVLLLQAGELSLLLCVIDVCLKNLEIVSGKMGKWELIGFEEASVML